MKTLHGANSLFFLVCEFHLDVEHLLPMTVGDVRYVPVCQDENHCRMCPAMNVNCTKEEERSFSKSPITKYAYHKCIQQCLYYLLWQTVKEDVT